MLKCPEALSLTWSLANPHKCSFCFSLCFILYNLFSVVQVEWFLKIKADAVFKVSQWLFTSLPMRFYLVWYLPPLWPHLLLSPFAHPQGLWPLPFCHSSHTLSRILPHLLFLWLEAPPSLPSGVWLNATLSERPSSTPLCKRAAPHPPTLWFYLLPILCTA